MNRKYILKLACIVAMLMLTVSVLVASTYAWFTMSGNPDVSGIAIAISGSNTIQFAPDITTVDENGNVLHYPGGFSDSLDFSRFPQYGYLQTVASLTPVSTGDGVHWFFPTYHTDSSDLTISGGLKDIDEFLMDDTLSLANSQENGCYVYVDFWVMAPADGYSLRVSTSTNKNDGEGSFVLAMPEVKTDENGKLYLAQGSEAAGASMRLGFLVNGETVSDNTMLAYTNLGYRDSRISSLRGVYAEPGSSYSTVWNRFSIYEPNGDWHDPEAKSYVMTPNGIQTATYSNGSYVKTYPVTWDAGFIELRDLTSITTVQKTNQWLSDGQRPLLDQRFQAYALNKNLEGLTASQILRGFSADLQGLFDTYVYRGDFIKSSQALSGAAGSSGAVSIETLGGLAASGATDDVVITQLDRGVAQRVRMFIWLEGQDVDCVTHQDVWNTIIRLEFAGGE